MSGSGLRGQVVVVTGASSGIGRATALECSRLGARVVVAARRQAALESLVDECGRMGGQAIAMALDVGVPSAMDDLAELAVETFGGIDVWVNNAGLYSVGPVRGHAGRRLRADRAGRTSWRSRAARGRRCASSARARPASSSTCPR